MVRSVVMSLSLPSVNSDRLENNPILPVETVESAPATTSSLVEQAVESVQKAKKKRRKKKKAANTPSATPQLTINVRLQPTESSEKMNLNYAYFALKLVRMTQSGALQNEAYRIPLALFQDSERELLLSTDHYTYIPRESDEADSVYFKRIIKRFKSNNADIEFIYHVASIAPLKIRGATSVHNSSARDFFSKYERTFSTTLSEAVRKIKDSNPSTERIVASSSRSQQMPIEYKPALDSTLTFTDADEAIQKFKGLSHEPSNFMQYHKMQACHQKVIEAFLNGCKKSGLLPQENFQFAWDLICYQLLSEKTKQNRLKVDQLIKSWLFIHEKIHLSFASANIKKGWTLNKEHLQKARKKLQALVNTESPLFDKKYLKKIQPLINPLVEWLEMGESCKTDFTCKEYFEYNDKLWFKNLKDLSLCTVYSQESWPLVSNWLNLRVNWIARMTQILELSQENRTNLEAILNKMQKAQAKNNLFEVLRTTTEMQKYLDTLQADKEAFKGNPFLFERFRLSLSTQGAALQELLNKASDYCFINFDALQEFINFAGKLSEELPKMDPKQFDPFKNWLKSLKKESYKELPDAFRELNSCWDEIKNLHQQVIKFEAEQKTAAVLQGCKKVEIYQAIEAVYSTSAPKIDELRDQLIILLTKANASIVKVQDFVFFTLTQEEAPKLDLSELRIQFKLLNKKIRNLLEPLCLYFNAHCQIFRPKENTTSSEAGHLTLQSALEVDLTFNLLQTNIRYFKSFQRSLDRLAKARLEATSHAVEMALEKATEDSPSLEIEPDEIEPALTTASPSATPLSEVSEFASKEQLLAKELNAAFRSHSTRHVLKSLKDLFKEYQIAYGSDWGKGDHWILQINRVRIPLPMHREWKRGTAKGIYNSIKEKLEIGK